MYLKFDGGFFDYDLDFVRDLFSLLDERLDRQQELIDECFAPDQMELFDEAEYIAGMGFVACQRYLASTYGQHDLQKDVALELGPHHDGGESYARILNAAANYWKHVDEWDTSATIARDVARLDDRQQRTIRIIESVTPWSDYTCANLLCELTPHSRFTDLIPTLEAWRERLDAANGG
jgi:hypothetical protein